MKSGFNLLEIVLTLALLSSVLLLSFILYNQVQKYNYYKNTIKEAIIIVETIQLKFIYNPDYFNSNQDIIYVNDKFEIVNENQTYKYIIDYQLIIEDENYYHLVIESFKTINESIIFANLDLGRIKV